MLRLFVVLGSVAVYVSAQSGNSISYDGRSSVRDQSPTTPTAEPLRQPSSYPSINLNGNVNNARPDLASPARLGNTRPPGSYLRPTGSPPVRVPPNAVDNLAPEFENNRSENDMAGLPSPDGIILNPNRKPADNENPSDDDNDVVVMPADRVSNRPLPDPTPDPYPTSSVNPQPDRIPNLYPSSTSSPQPNPRPNGDPDFSLYPLPNSTPELDPDFSLYPRPRPTPGNDPAFTFYPQPVPSSSPLPDPTPGPDYTRYPQPDPTPGPFPLNPTSGPFPNPTPSPFPDVSVDTTRRPYPTPPPYLTPVPPTASSIAISNLRNFTCRHRNRYYSIVGQCDTYVACKGYHPKKYVCPDGLQFNPRASYPQYPCAYPSEVRCVGKFKRKPEPTKDCPQKYGFYATADGECSRYVMCQEGIAKMMHCPLGLVFNDKLSSCDWPANVPRCNPDVFKDFQCPAVREKDDDKIYKYRYGTYCRYYIACQRGYPRLLSCEDGLAFEENSQTCIYNENVRGCEMENDKLVNHLE